WLLPVYVCIAATVGIGLLTRRTVWSVVFGAVLATGLFFLVTNFCVWAFGAMYPGTAVGLLACYAAALPFAGNMLLSSIAFGLGLLFLWNVAEQRFPQLVLAR